MQTFQAQQLGAGRGCGAAQRRRCRSTVVASAHRAGDFSPEQLASGLQRQLAHSAARKESGRTFPGAYRCGSWAFREPAMGWLGGEQGRAAGWGRQRPCL